MKTRMLVCGAALLMYSLAFSVKAQSIVVSGYPRPVPEPSPIVLAGVGAAAFWLWLFWRGVD